ncbi:hypothetical protein Q5752_002030 [Cryptotrichosporon argae]
MGILLLLGQSAAMFAASVACGSLPLLFKSRMSDRTLKCVSVFGMGILVGAALTIIIPEGVGTLYESLDGGAEHDESTTMAIGLSLLTGFGLMLLIEALTPHAPTPPSTPTTPSPSSSSRRSDERDRPLLPHANSHTPIVPKLHLDEPAPFSSIHGLAATLGLVIHGAADGIALGASSLSARKSLGFIVFLAVLVHKGPTALGLTTTLLSLSMPTPMIRRRLVAFSLAAPAGALLTYLLVRLFGQGAALGWWTGIALLFSGGSFLYVATVVQPLSADDHAPAPGPHADAHAHDAVGKYARVALLVGGMCLPVLLVLIVGDHD